MKEEKKKLKEEKITLVKYTDKSFALYGDTKSIKDILIKNGGIFNPRLKVGPGWLF